MLKSRLSRHTVRGDCLAESLVQLFEEVAPEGASLIGVSVPGPLTVDRRGIAFTGNLELRDYPLARLLEERLGAPVALDDDANCAALAEATFGAARRTSSSVCIVVGTGVGAGIVMDGRIVRGAHGTAGELGHLVVEPNGRVCSCGNHGCLEAMTNGAALVDYAQGRFPSAEAVLAAASRGEDHALSAVDTAARYLAVGTAAAAMMLDPECIVLCGGIGRQPGVVERVRRGAPAFCIEPVGGRLDIRAGALADDAGLVGAALVATRDRELVGPRGSGIL